jgi:glycosyltransferase involved in cell wall biosynthesis
MTGRPAYSAVVPVYGNEATLPELVRRLQGVSRRLDDALEVVFVVDGSPDRSAQVLRALAPAADLAVQIIEHSRNFGAFAAIRTGLQSARGSYLAVISADLQEPVELVEDFFAALKSGGSDVTVGVRMSRTDPMLSSVAARIYWGFYRRVVVRQIPPGGVDVFACTAQVRDSILAMNESHSSLIAQLYWLGYRRTEIPYSRLERVDGASGWSWRMKFTYMQDSIFAFSPLPITLLAVVGTAGTLLTLLGSAVVAIAWLAGGITVAGYTPIMLALLLSTSLLLAGLGIVGSYVWRTYENSKSRPLSVVAWRELYDD